MGVDETDLDKGWVAVDLLLRGRCSISRRGKSAIRCSDEALVEERLTEHRNNPDSAVSLETMKSRLRSQFRSELADKSFLRS